MLSHAFIFDAFADTSDFGTSGLIKMPSARMAADGTLRATISRDELADNFNITFQALPRVQATFRYSIFDPDGLGSGSNPPRDRSYGVKAQLLPETHWLPAVAVGMRDIVGTGVWQGEYLVASKAWNGLDATLGLGWGRLGSRSGFSNPLGLISDRFDERPGRRKTGGDYGGKSRYGSFFRGDAAIFGGLTYRFSNTPLTFVAEYESDQYDREVALGILDKRPSAFNFGLNWEPIKNIHLRVSWLRGDTLG
ncbi:MAG: YjbH domain-containing protein, partial [Pseudomonadota bacterium]|nr:YjbH domain-containing protein [Pseudomonadota bacterium]